MMAASDFRLDVRHLAANVEVIETEDWWIIPDCIGLREGVHNRWLHQASELERTYGTLEGVPITEDHPPFDLSHAGLLALWPAEVLGYALNARWDAASRGVGFDAFLFRRADVAGLQTIESVIHKNAQTVARILAGEMLDVSTGYYCRATKEAGVFDGRGYDEVDHDIGYYHVAIVPSGGACNWADGCGLGRAQETR